MAVDFEAVRKIALAQADVTEKLGARGWAFRLRGQLLACQAIHRSAEAGSLVVKIGLAERSALIAENPAVYYVTTHYVGYPCVLVRLSAIDERGFAALLKRSSAFMMGETAERSTAKGPRTGTRPRTGRQQPRRR